MYASVCNIVLGEYAGMFTGIRVQYSNRCMFAYIYTIVLRNNHDMYIAIYI